MADGCHIVGLLDLTSTANYLISVSSSASTEANEVDGELIIGPTIGNISITGYADTVMARSSTGGGSASVNINYIQKYDCDNDMIYLIFAGGGQSSISGDVGGLASVTRPVGTTNTLNASIVSGPSTPYFEGSVETGYGLNYSGLPISFDTSSDAVFSLRVGDIGTGYLRSFSLNYTAGTLPTATYNFIFAPDDNLIVIPNGG